MLWGELPTELWVEIFRYATYVPKASIAPEDPFEPQIPWRTVMGPNTPILSRLTKCSLRLVCRSWNSLATEILFEHLTIRSSWRADRILNALNGTYGVALSGSPYGSFTRHIETYDSDLPCLQRLAAIMRLCPNVRMLSFNWNNVAPEPAFLEFAAHLYKHTVVRFCWVGGAYMYGARSSGPAYDFVRAFEHLRVLDIRGSPITIASATGPTFLRLEQLVISAATVPYACALQLPALHRVVFAGPVSDDELDLLATAHGDRIEAFEFMDGVHGSCGHNLATLLNVTKCPRLQDLVFDVWEAVIDPLLQTHPALRRVAIRGVGEVRRPAQEKPDTLQCHFERLMSPDFPGLKVVQVVRLSLLPWNSDMEEVYSLWMGQFRFRGINLEDGEGRMLWSRRAAAKKIGFNFKF